MRTARKPSAHKWTALKASLHFRRGPAPHLAPSAPEQAGFAAPDDGHALLEADQRFQAALDQAIAKGRERIEAVEATVQLKRHTKLSL
jgi:hypothetical protein